MKIKRIVGEAGTMALLCKNGLCPAAILTEGDQVFVQGYTPKPNESAELTAPAGEGFVRMSRSTFEKIARQFLGS